MNKQLIMTVIALSVPMLAGGSVLAESMTLSGITYYVMADEQSQELPDGRVLITRRAEGFSTAPHNTFPRNENCVTTAIVEKDGQTENGAGYCWEVDRDGDRTWLWVNLTEGTWGYLYGTGKYEGIKGGGTSEISYRWDDGRFLVPWKGSWEIR